MTLMSQLFLVNQQQHTTRTVKYDSCKNDSCELVLVGESVTYSLTVLC